MKKSPKINIPHKYMICIILIIGIALQFISLQFFQSAYLLQYTAIALIAFFYPM